MPATPVLFVDHADALGGAEKILLLLLEFLDRDRFAPHLVAPTGALTIAARQLGVAVHELELAQLRGVPTAPWRLARAVVPLTQLLRRERIAVVYAHSIRASVYAAAAAALARRPFLWHLHEPAPPGIYSRLLCALSDAAIAVSTAVARDAPCPHKVRVIHNGIRSADFAGDHGARAAALRTAWGVPLGAVLIGQVARLQRWKGQNEVIAAAEMLLRDHPDVYVAIIGGDIFGDAAAYERELKTRVAQRGLSRRVLFTGHQEDIPAVLSALDILVHASTDEPFGTILLEGAAAGVPMVAYESGGVPELLTHEQTALLVSQGDRAGLAAALARLVTDHDLTAALSAAARARVLREFDIHTMVRRIEDVLASLVFSVPIGATGRSAE